MPTTILYKYLDFKGGLMMLQNSNIQFTNATKFNDPFDCHPDLFDFSDAPTNKYNWPPADFISKMKANDMKNFREMTWICCLSKVCDSLLMWAYYNNHKGICIGLNTETVLKSCQDRFIGLMAPQHADEVKYRKVGDNKPNYFKNRPSAYDLLITKADDWKHEQEFRLITQNPAWAHGHYDVPREFYDEEIVDGKEMRYYPKISKDCFEEVYLGVNMLPRKKAQIIDLARNLNPSIRIYQIVLDTKAFKLMANPVDAKF